MIVECPGCQSRYDVSGRPAGTRVRCRCSTVFTLPEPSSSAGYLRCPQCDAAVGPGDRSCAFCSAHLAVKACPRCFGRIFAGSKHCRLCGAEVDVPATADPDGNATPRNCPRCRDRRLEGRLVDGFLLDECNTCHGVYVDAATLERIITERRQASAAEAAGMLRRSGGNQAPSQPAGPMYVECPDCEQLMNRNNFAKSSGIIVDVCRSHGTWFDAEELPRIVEFARDGGMERGAERSAQRTLEEARCKNAQRRGQSGVGSVLSRRMSGSFTLGAFVGAIGGGLFD